MWTLRRKRSIFRSSPDSVLKEVGTRKAEFRVLYSDKGWFTGVYEGYGFNPNTPALLSRCKEKRCSDLRAMERLTGGVKYSCAHSRVVSCVELGGVYKCPRSLHD